MAVRGWATIDELQWEGDSTVGVHLVYVGIADPNPHDPEVYGGFWVTALDADQLQATLNATLAQALKDQLTNAHGFTLDVGDTVRILWAGTVL